MISKRKHIVFIWGAYPPTIGGASARIYRVSAHLSKFFRISIFTSKVKNSIIKETIGDLKIYRVPPNNPKISHSNRLLYYLKIFHYFLVISTRFLLLYPCLFFICKKDKPIAIIKEATTWDFEIMEQKVKLKSLFLLFQPWVFTSKFLNIPLYVYFTNLWHYRENTSYIGSKLEHADYVIIVDSWMKTHLKEKFTINKPIYYLPVSIDCDSFRENNSKFPNENKILLISRFSKERGCDTLIKSIPYVQNEIQSFKVEIIGDGAEKNNLITLAKDLGVCNCVTFIGEIDPKDISIYYNRAKVFVNPLRVPGIGNTTLEAMASGVPVIKSKMKNMENEPILEGINGFSFEIDNYIDLAKKIVEVLKLTEDEWIKLSHNCRKTAEMYDIQETSTKIIQILHPK
jgi:glycosyltransferase involved in cell wall biosynthesis